MSDNLSSFLAARIKGERDRRGWSLADLAARAEVSKGMLSKIEREEVSPTASILARIASGLGLTLAALLTQEDETPDRLVRKNDQPTWRDPESKYLRRQVYLNPASSLELTEITLPAGKAQTFPASSYSKNRHVVWVLDGVLTITEGRAVHELGAGDRLEFGQPGNLTYSNKTRTRCRYLVAVVRTAA